MAARQSVQEVNRTSTPIIYNPPSDIGKEWTFYFNYVCASFASADTLDLVTLPKGARILAGVLVQDGLGSSTTLVIGITGTTNKYLTSTSTASAAKTTFADTIAQNIGDVLTADTTIFATLGGANATDGKLIKGYMKVLYT